MFVLFCAQTASWLLVWQYVYQDDYGNVDNSHWGFETACDQHFADKALHNDGEHSLNKLAHSVAECAAHISGYRLSICSRCSVISAVWLFALNTQIKFEFNLNQLKLSSC